MLCEYKIKSRLRFERIPGFCFTLNVFWAGRNPLRNEMYLTLRLWIKHGTPLSLHIMDSSMMYVWCMHVMYFSMQHSCVCYEWMWNDCMVLSWMSFICIIPLWFTWNLQSTCFWWCLGWDLLNFMKIEYANVYGLFVGKAFWMLGLKLHANNWFHCFDLKVLCYMWREGHDMETF